jgi:hypothetical protein
VDELVDTVSIELAAAPAAGVMLVGENEQVAPVGNPEQLNETGAVNPICGVTFTVSDADFPAGTDRLEAEVVREKFPVGVPVAREIATLPSRSPVLSRRAMSTSRNVYNRFTLTRRAPARVNQIQS